MKYLTMSQTKNVLLIIFISWALNSCQSSQKKMAIDRERALLAPTSVELRDDLDSESLAKNIRQHLNYLKSQKQGYLQFGAVTISTESYSQFLQRILELNKKGSRAAKEWVSEIGSMSDCYPVHGDGKAGQAFITSYFEPEILASRKPTGKHWRPIYKLPNDMVLVQLGEFQKSFPHWSVLPVTEQKSQTPVARGRIVKGDPIPSIVPYWNRYEIDGLGVLKGKNLEIAYADPVDVFVMQIQGSGTLNFSNGKFMRVGYLAQNGHPYEALGKFLKDKIPPEQMNLQTIENHMRSLPPEQVDLILAQNPSYVFFTPISGSAKTTIGTEVVPGRTIATDRQYFPKGVLAFVQFDKPVFSDEKSVQPTGWENVGRLVFDQDTGGAIRGTGRLDLFWGQGQEAKQAAGVMKQWGKLCYLAPKASTNLPSEARAH